MKALRWRIDCGTLHTTVSARTAARALILAVQRQRPRQLGELARFRRLCCRNPNHAPHFVHYWLNPIPVLRRASLLTRPGVQEAGG